MMKKLSLGSAALVSLFQRHGLEPAAAVKQVYSELYSEIAASLPAVDFADGVLNLGTRSAMWRKEGERMAESLASGINRALGKNIVQRIAFVPWRRNIKKVEPYRQQSASIEPSKGLLTASQRIGNERVRQAFVKFGAAIEACRDGKK